MGLSCKVQWVGGRGRQQRAAEEEGRVRTRGPGTKDACQPPVLRLPARAAESFWLTPGRPGWLHPPCRSGLQQGPLGFFADIDECADPDACGEARCKNLPGSYSCLCDEGYEFSSQDKACRGTHPSRRGCRHVHTPADMYIVTHTCAFPHTCAHTTPVCTPHTGTHMLLDAAGHLLLHLCVSLGRHRGKFPQEDTPGDYGRLGLLSSLSSPTVFGGRPMRSSLPS